MTASRLIAILAFLAQFVNVAAVYTEQLPPKYAIWVAAFLAAFQAFTDSIKKKSAKSAFSQFLNNIK